MVLNGVALLRASPIKNMLLDKVSEHGVSHGLAEVGYDIRVKQDIHFKPALFHMMGTLTQGPMFCVGNAPTYSHGNFAIASAIEEFDMPSDLMAIVHDKSTWARQGLSVFNTVIEPGWKGFLTLELVFHGNKELIIPAGSGIAQVVFHQLAERRPYTGKYQNQEDEPIASRFE